jgi:UDP-2-acetamido-2-deoxy-ribo-hexuluronate aminotransferase
VYVDRRDEVRSQLADRGIETAVHYPRPLHLQPAYADCGVPRGTLPHSERACNRVISLPFYPGLHPEQINHVANALREIVGVN